MTVVKPRRRFQKQTPGTTNEAAAPLPNQARNKGTKSATDDKVGRAQNLGSRFTILTNLEGEGVEPNLENNPSNDGAGSSGISEKERKVEMMARAQQLSERSLVRKGNAPNKLSVVASVEELLANLKSSHDNREAKTTGNQ